MVPVANGVWALVPHVPIATPFPVTGILASGQSLSVGSYGTPFLTTGQPYSNAQLHNANPLDGGLWTYTAPDSGAWTLIPLIAPERVELYDGAAPSAQYPYNIGGETPDIAMADALSSMMGGSEFLCTNAGQGGVGFSVIGKGGTGNAYQSLLNEATVATGKNVGYGGGINLLTHGEADAAGAAGTYSAWLVEYQSQLQTDVSAITSQTRALPLILSQQNAYPVVGSGANQSALEQLLATQPGTSMVKLAATSAWDSGAISTGVLSGNGYVQAQTAAGGFNTIFGLSNGWTTTSFSDIAYAMDLSSPISVYEAGSSVYTGPTLAAGDVVSITVTGTTVTYQKNGVTFYTSLAAATLPLAVKVSMYSQNYGLVGIKLSTGATLAPWLHQTGVAIPPPGTMLFSGPKYYFPPSPSNRGHLTALGYQELGEQYARTYYRSLSPTGWTPLVPKSTTRIGNVVTVAFSVPVGPLQWSTAFTAPHQSGALAAWSLGQGFEARTGGASGSIVTINSVAIDATGTKVVITCATQPDTIAYATTPDNTTPGTPTGGFPDGRCGLLRDSDPFVGPITAVAQANWAPEFQVTGL
jgi:hypothetical protein